jgi:hyperosmotically inducible periplasmic protein
MKTTILILCAAFAAASAGCNRDRALGGERDDDRRPKQSAIPAGAPNDDANNTRRNERDREGQLTPGDQLENERDLTITQNIRKAVMADDSLSFTAKNAKIITRNGVVTLKGPVKDEHERRAIEAAAAAVAGADNVSNQLELDTSNVK